MDEAASDSHFEGLRERLAARGPASAERVRAPRAAVAVVLVPCAAGLELLLIRRAERAGDPWSGHMGLPGGRMEDADPDLLATARRETREETRVELPQVALLGRLDDLHPISAHLPSIVIRPFVFGLATRPSVGANQEVAYHRWVPLRQLSANRGHTLVEYSGEQHEMAAFSLGRDVVWGLTHRILDPLVRLFE